MEPDLVPGIINVAIKAARKMNLALMARLAADEDEKYEDPYLSVKTFLT